MKIPSLPEISLGRPITVLMLTISLLSLGMIARYRIPVEFMPEIEFPFIICYVPYPGASPEQVEKEVAIPAEGQFGTIPGLREVSSTSDTNGCNIRMMFDWNVDMSVATAEVRDRMERLKLEIPDEIDRIFLRKFSIDAMPVMVFTLYREGDLDETAYLVRERIQPRLARIEGVADVQIYSKPPAEVLIEFDQERLRSANVGMYQVIEQLRGANFSTSVGEIFDGDTKHFVRVAGEIDHPDDLADLTIAENGLKLSDVADVGFKSRTMRQEYAIDRNPGAFVLIQKEAEANAIATCDRVSEELEIIKQDPQFAGFDELVLFNQSENIMGAVNSLADAGKYGALLALCVLYFFLRRIRPTIVVALAIPTSLVGGLAFMYLSGMTLNLVTMTSMIIAIGLLVDNSIVVMENIFRHRDLGETPFEAARKGATEVGLAITAATMTTLVVFVPTFYVDAAEMATYMRQFALPVSASLIASLVIALTLIPLAASRMKPTEETHGHRMLEGVRRRLPSRLTKGAPKPLFAIGNWMKRGYLNALSWSLKNRFTAIALTLGFVIFTYAVPAKQMQMQEMPTVDTRRIDLSFEFEQNFDFEMAKEVVDLVETQIDGMREELEIKNIWREVQAWGAELTIYLKTPEDYAANDSPKYSTEDTLNVLWERLPEKIPGAEINFMIPDAGEGQARSVQFRMRGDDIATLRVEAERFGELLRGFPEITHVKVGEEDLKQEVQIHIDENLLDRVAVSPFAIAQTVDFSLRGTRLTPIKREGREIPVWAQFRESDRETRENLENVGIAAGDGSVVPLNELVDFRKAKMPRAIWRTDGKNILAVTIQMSTNDVGALYAKIKAFAKTFELPRGYSIDLGDDVLKLDENAANFMTSAMLASVLIYFVMAALFESYLLPISILMSIPMAFVGVVWVMVLTQTPIDTISFIGIILLLGLVVNNGIVIVDYINQLRKQGMDRHEAIIKAGRDRLRPVLMTATTTILGCIPLAMEPEAGAEVSFESLGRCLIGGLTTGTVLTLYVTPLAYTCIDDLSIWLNKFSGDMRGLRSGSGVDSAPTEEIVAK